MLVTTNAIVLSYKKYKETSILCSFFTEKEGYLSFIVKGIYGRSKKTSHFFPLNMVELVYQQKKNQESLHFLNSIATIHYKSSIYVDPIKTAQVFFIAELLQTFLKKENSPNSSFYQSIEEWIEIFDQKQDNYSEFHLYLITQLIKLLGISPNLNNSHFPYFDMLNASYSINQNSTSMFLVNEEKILFHQLIQLSFSKTSLNCLSSTDRKKGLKLLLNYLTLHIGSFNNLISIEVLSQLEV